MAKWVLGLSLCNDDGLTSQRYAPIAAVNGYQYRDVTGSPAWTRDRVIAEAMVARLNQSE